MWRESQIQRLLTNILQREKINGTDYNLRAQIIHKICQSSRSVLRDNNSVVDCHVALAWLAKKLFYLVPSFIETTECTKCLTKIKEFSIIAPGVPDYDLKPTELDLISKYCGILESVTDCANQACNAKFSVLRNLAAIGKYDIWNIINSSTNSIHILGDVVMFEVTNNEDTSEAIALSQIPKKIKNPLTDKLDIILIGVCCYKPPINQRRNPQASILSKDTQMGHYTSLIYRWATQTWKEIDDLQINNTKTGRKDSYKIVPCFLVYINLSGQNS